MRGQHVHSFKKKNARLPDEPFFSTARKRARNVGVAGVNSWRGRPIFEGTARRQEVAACLTIGRRTPISLSGNSTSSTGTAWSAGAGCMSATTAIAASTPSKGRSSWCANSTAAPTTPAPAAPTPAARSLKPRSRRPNGPSAGTCCAGSGTAASPGTGRSRRSAANWPTPTASRFRSTPSAATSATTRPCWRRGSRTRRRCVGTTRGSANWCCRSTGCSRRRATRRCTWCVN